MNQGFPETQQTLRFLNPGDYFFGHAAGQVKTLLGSCVSLVLWHPRTRILAVTHNLLPMAPPGMGLRLVDGAGRYIDRSLNCLCRDMNASGTHWADYRKALFGGASLSQQPLSRQKLARTVGARNAEYALAQARSMGWNFETVDVGGPFPRRLIIDGASGNISCIPVKSQVGEARA